MPYSRSRTIFISWYRLSMWRWNGWRDSGTFLRWMSRPFFSISTFRQFTKLWTLLLLV